MNKIEFETWPMAKLRIDPNNARKHDQKNIDAIANSLARFGQRKPIVVVGDGTIVAGNGTAQAAKQLGWTEIVVARIPWRWTPEEIKAYALADNRTAELAEWDAEMLADQLLELDAVGWDVSELGFPELSPDLVENKDDGEGLFNESDTTPMVFHLNQKQMMVIQSALRRIKESKFSNTMNDKNINSTALVVMAEEWLTNGSRNE